MQAATPVRQGTIGIIGGVSDVATVEYYRQLNQAVRRLAGGRNIARTLIDGLNVAEVVDWLARGDSAAMEAAFESTTERLLRAGADVIMCASNTCHMVMDTIAERRDIPLLHIADVTADAIAAAGLKRVVLLGSRETMEQAFLRDRLRARAGVDCVVPDARERREIDRIIFEELVEGRIEARSRLTYVTIARRLMAAGEAEGVVLGCTEIGLLVQQDDMPDVPLFDTTALHCEAAARLALDLARPAADRRAA